MISKFLEKRIEIITQEITDDPGNPLELEYYLVECDLSKEEESNVTGKGYGIEIIKKKNGDLMESIIMRNIYCSREKSKDFIKKMAENTVTPVSLPYILDDLIGI